MYYKNLFDNNNRVNQQLFDVNKQISSGQSIQYAYENTDTFVKTMRLDDEITTFNQVKKSVESGLKFSNQTDSTLGELTKTLDAFKVKMIQAASDVHSPASMEALADELKAIRNNLLSLSNSSINGQYLFSGTALNVKPINQDGSYNGNDAQMTSMMGNNVDQAYNVTGQDLFFGEESQTQRKISTNVKQLNQSELYPDIMQELGIPRSSATEEYITPSSTIRDLVGDIHTIKDINNGLQTYKTTHFYIRGTQHDGSSFKQMVTMTGDESVATLMEKIGEAYGNTSTSQVVNVTMNEHGQIEIEDKLNGSSKLDFHMVAATDFDQLDGNDEADVNDALAYPIPNTGLIDNLDAGSNDIEDIFSGANDLLITEFVKSGFTTTSPTTIDALSYDRIAFEKDGATLSSNVPQIVKADNSFAVPTTKLVDVASGTTLHGTTLNFEGTDILGNAFTATIDFDNAGSTFSLDGGVTNYTIFNTGVDPKAPVTALNPQAATPADDVTYKQLMDVINMVTTNNLPASVNTVNAQGIAADYAAAIQASEADGRTRLTSDGKIEFEEIGATATQAGISLYDATAADFANTVPGDDPNVDASSAMTFNVNNALTISDPKTDFFARIDEMIASVEQMKLRADSESGDPRNGGMQNGIQMLDDLMDHVSRQQSKSGVNSQTLSATRDRTEVLIVSSMSLRSDVIDTDIAEASLQLQQLSLNMQAIYSMTSKISQLSLVNYL
jgi:flagellar hook-associated protein 3 FlgL